MLARFADHPAHAAVIVVALEIDTGTGAVGEPLLASERTLSGAAHLAGSAFRSAGAAVVRIGLRVDAQVVALGRSAAALKRACTLNADFAVCAFLAASAAVVGIALGSDACISTLCVVGWTSNHRGVHRGHHAGVVRGHDRISTAARDRGDARDGKQHSNQEDSAIQSHGKILACSSHSGQVRDVSSLFRAVCDESQSAGDPGP
jgi:hypothetical protein